jgi:paired amphipathic helix protein Sin3a
MICFFRYDYDLNIDANLNCIALLEPIVKNLETMSPEEQEAFTLSPGLGGQSTSIYERIIKKIYGVERGREVIQLLLSDPARVAPLVMKRLKQKYEEWTKAQVRKDNLIKIGHILTRLFRMLSTNGTRRGERSTKRTIINHSTTKVSHSNQQNAKRSQLDTCLTKLRGYTTTTKIPKNRTRKDAGRTQRRKHLLLWKPWRLERWR